MAQDQYDCRGEEYYQKEHSSEKAGIVDVIAVKGILDIWQHEMLEKLCRDGLYYIEMNYWKIGTESEMVNNGKD